MYTAGNTTLFSKCSIGCDEWHICLRLAYAWGNTMCFVDSEVLHGELAWTRRHNYHIQVQYCHTKSCSPCRNESTPRQIIFAMQDFCQKMF